MVATAGSFLHEGSGFWRPSGGVLRGPAAAKGFGERSAKMSRSSKPGASTRVSPSVDTASECPSNTSESFPPTRLHSAIGMPWRRAAAATMWRRTWVFPSAYGEAERFTSTCAPWRASSSAGSRAYRGFCQKSLSFQRSSQMDNPTRTPAISTTVTSGEGSK